MSDMLEKFKKAVPVLEKLNKPDLKRILSAVLSEMHFYIDPLRMLILQQVHSRQKLNKFFQKQLMSGLNMVQ